MRTATISSIQNGMATVVYRAKSKDASIAMPILDTPANKTLQPGDNVVVAELNGKRDGIVIGKYWNTKNYPREE